MILYYDFGGEDISVPFEYEIELDKAEDAIRKILRDYSHDDLVEIIIDMEFAERGLEYFREELTKYFESDARESWKYR